MPGQFYSAADVARVQARQSAQNAQLQYDAEMQKQKAEQNQKMAQSAQTNIDAALKTVATAAQHWVDQGKDIADPTFHDAMDPLVRGAIETSAMYSMNGLPVVTPDVLQQQFENIYTAPSRVQTATLEGQADLAKENIVGPAKKKNEIIAQNENQLLDAYDVKLGKFTQATRAEMDASNGGVIPLSARETPTSADLKTVVNTKDGTVKSAFWDGRSRRLTGLDGNALGAEWVPTTVSGTPEETGVTTASKTKIEEKVMGLDDSLALAQEASKQFKAAYLQLPTQWLAGGLAALEKAGMKLSASQEKLVGDITKFKQNAISGLNLGIKAITGASMTQGEIERLRAQFPDPEKDGPTQFKAKLDQSIAQMRLSRARAVWMAKQGIQFDWNSGDEPPVSLEQFPVIMRRRAEEIRTTIKQEQPDLQEGDVETAVARAIQKEFGG